MDGVDPLVDARARLLLERAGPGEVPRGQSPPRAARRDEHVPPRRGTRTTGPTPDNFTLQDAPSAVPLMWTLPSHLFLVSGWSAACSDPTDPMSCRSDLTLEGDRRGSTPSPRYAWTDVTWLSIERRSWGYYIGKTPVGYPPCPPPERRGFETSYQRNVLPGFTSFWDGERPTGIEDNMLPSTTTSPRRRPAIFPTSRGSCRRRSTASTRTVRRPSRRAWHTSRDHQRGDGGAGLGIDGDLPDVGRLGRLLRPRRAARVDDNGYGLRVPALVISPWAKPGSSTTRRYRSIRTFA